MKRNLNDPAIQPLAERIARAATLVQEQRTGQEPNSVLVVISGKMITVTLRGKVSSAEPVIDQSAEGAAKEQEDYRESASHASELLRRRIQLIIGLDVREAGSVHEPASRTAVEASTAGTLVQTFLLSESVPSESFSEIRESDLPMNHAHTATLLPAA